MLNEWSDRDAENSRPPLRDRMFAFAVAAIVVTGSIAFLVEMVLRLF